MKPNKWHGPEIFLHPSYERAFPRHSIHFSTLLMHIAKSTPYNLSHWNVPAPPTLKKIYPEKQPHTKQQFRFFLNLLSPYSLKSNNQDRVYGPHLPPISNASAQAPAPALCGHSSIPGAVKFFQGVFSSWGEKFWVSHRMFRGMSEEVFGY
jgi:hypothetical protein